MVIENIETRVRENIIRPDMINLLIEAKKGELKHEEHADEDAGFATVEESHIGKSEKRKIDLSEDDLAAQALIFFFAGFETASTIMSFMITELAINDDAQKILLKEVDETLNNCGDNLSYEVIRKMKYLDQVVSGKNCFLLYSVFLHPSTSNCSKAAAKIFLVEMQLRVFFFLFKWPSCISIGIS